MKKELDDLYGGLWRAPGLSYEIRRTAAAFVFLMVLAFGVCMAVPSLGDRAAGYIAGLMGELNVTAEDGSLSFTLLFFNNLRACMFTMLYGLMPFLYLPALALGVNAIILGSLGAWYLNQGFSLAGYLAALIPHGIFEIPALILSMAMGLCVCGHLTRRFRGDGTALRLWDCLALISRMLLLALWPLLAAAALMEAYVTPSVAALFT